MITFELRDFLTWNVVIIFKGDKYGRNNLLTHDKNEPLVAFYDVRYPFDKDIDGNVLGQFASRYYLSTLLKVESVLNLDGRVEQWAITETGMKKVKDLLNSYAHLCGNKF